MDEIVLTKDQLDTAVMMYLKEVRGVPFERVVEVRVPVYTGGGDVTAVAAVRRPS